jgi:hypothetical protein
MKARVVELILDLPGVGLIDVSVEGGIDEDDVFVFRDSDGGAGSLNVLVDFPMGLVKVDDNSREVDCCLPLSYLSLRGWAKAELIEKIK